MREQAPVCVDHVRPKRRQPNGIAQHGQGRLVLEDGQNTRKPRSPRKNSEPLFPVGRRSAPTLLARARPQMRHPKRAPRLEIDAKTRATSAHAAASVRAPMSIAWHH